MVGSALDADEPAGHASVAAGAHVADLSMVPNAGHTRAVSADHAGYEARLASFFGEALGAANG